MHRCQTSARRTEAGRTVRPRQVAKVTILVVSEVQRVERQEVIPEVRHPNGVPDIAYWICARRNYRFAEGSVASQQLDLP